MDTIVNAAFETIFYFIDRFSKKKEELEKFELYLRPKEKSGVYIIPKMNKIHSYSIKLPEKDTLIDNLEFESTSDIGVGSTFRLVERKDRNVLIFVAPQEIYSREFFSDIADVLLKRGRKK